MKLGVFDAEGLPLGFYDPDVHGDAIPESAIKITDEQWSELVHYQGVRKWENGQVVVHTPPLAAAPARLFSKRKLFGAMTDSQYATFLEHQAQQSPRMPAVFTAATELSESDPDWPQFLELMQGAYGKAEAARLLSEAEV